MPTMAISAGPRPNREWSCVVVVVVDDDDDLLDRMVVMGLMDGRGEQTIVGCDDDDDDDGHDIDLVCC